MSESIMFDIEDDGGVVASSSLGTRNVANLSELRELVEAYEQYDTPTLRRAGLVASLLCARSLAEQHEGYSEYAFRRILDAYYFVLASAKHMDAFESGLKRGIRIAAWRPDDAENRIVRALQKEARGGVGWPRFGLG